jgi:hypothetical protein
MIRFSEGVQKTTRKFDFLDEQISDLRLNDPGSRKRIAEKVAAATDAAIASRPMLKAVRKLGKKQLEDAVQVHAVSVQAVQRPASNHDPFIISQKCNAACLGVPRKCTNSSVPTELLSWRERQVQESPGTHFGSPEAAAYSAIIPKYMGLCGTAECLLVNPNSHQKVRVRALLDSGANVSMIEQHTSKQLGLSGKKQLFCLNVAGGGNSTETVQEVAFQLESLDGKFSQDMVGIVTEKVGTPFQPIDFDPRNHSYLSGLKLADKFPNPRPRPIQVLLSEPYFSQLQVDETVRHPDPAYPIAQRTKLGWILRGATGIYDRIPTAQVFSSLAYTEECFDLETMYKSCSFDFGKFWSGENVGIKPQETMHSEHTALEIQALEFHKQTAKFDPHKKQWSVCLPWIDPDREAHRMTDNTNRATAFFHRTVEKVKPEHLPMVDDAYKELVDQGFAELVPPEERYPEWPTYVMTSRPVFRFDRATTKCRIVINASLIDPRDKSKSLNKMLMPGPNLLPQIMELILRLQQKQFIFLIDVRKMFLAVKLQLKSDKDMLRYLWGEPGKQPDLYRLTSLGFGILSSPFQAMQCLRGSAAALASKYPEAAQSIDANTYMDDNSDGRETILATAELLKDILTVMDSGGFHGHKIAASHPEILEGLDESRLDRSRIVKVLGLKLDFDTNEFMFNLDEKFEDFNPSANTITRRNIVAVASRIFNTQGFVSPYVMQYKQILPLMWANNTGWDENLVGRQVRDSEGSLVPDPIAQQAVELFKEWFADIPQLKQLRFTRYLPGKLDKVAIFGDASKKGIGAVAYVVKRQPDGTRKSQIVYSKSTLMPKDLRKKDFQDALTIARAELIAITCCINMSTYIQNALRPNVVTGDVHIFTDSLLNLQRIQRGKGHCKVWEERRVCQVLDNKGDTKIHFCPGKLNPADLPSRGCHLPELVEQLSFWKEGPDFLLLNEDEWPKQPVIAGGTQSESVEAEEDPGEIPEVQLYLAQAQQVQQEQVEQERQVTKAHMSSEDTLEHPLDKMLRKFSSLRAVKVAITAFRRAQKKFRKQPHQVTSAVMTASEELAAERELARHIQGKHLSKEISIAQTREKQDEEVLKFQKGSVLRDLPVYWDSQRQLLRLKSRLHTSTSLEFEFKNPIILPKCDYAQRVAVDIHQMLRHASQKHTYEQLRLKYWQQGGYNFVKSAVREGCKTPRCRYVKFETPRMSPLPLIRMDKPEAWSHVGVDYFGPIQCIHDCNLLQCPRDVHGRSCKQPSKNKVWGALFTCMHTRSIHVELVQDCSTQQFLMAFRRFTHTRGRPLTFYSDNATTFKGADKQLQQLFRLTAQDAVKDYAYEGFGPIEWNYSTEVAPWTNGCTERLVGLFKRQFMATLQKHAVPFRTLETLCMEIAYYVNERPLGQVIEGETERMITPNMLATGRSLRPLTTPSIATLQSAGVNAMWEQRKKILLDFGKKWQAEYLSTLSVDKKWAKGMAPAIKPGDVVLLKPETQEKGQWRLARVTDVHRNLDGAIITVSVQLANKAIYTRSVRSVALLEPSAEQVDRNQRENPVEAPSESRGATCGQGLMETVSLPSVANEQGTEDPRPLSLSPRVQEAGDAGAEYSGEADTTEVNPGPIAPALQSSQETEEPAVRRSKRARKHKGYYKLLNEGRL